MTKKIKKRFKEAGVHPRFLLEENTIWHVYMVRCGDQTLYTGVTNDLQKRIRKHNDGTGAKYTRPRGRRPVVLVFARSIGDRGAAQKIEYELKQLSKDEKERLVIEYGVPTEPCRYSSIQNTGDIH